MMERLTPEFCRSNDIIFHPKNSGDAQSIQKALFGMGIFWADGSKTIKHTDECVKCGLVIQKGKIYYKGENDNTRYIAAAMEQLDEDYLSPDRKFMMEQFNKISARLDEMDRKFDELRREILPYELEKPAPGFLKKEKGAQP